MLAPMYWLGLDNEELQVRVTKEPMSTVLEVELNSTSGITVVGTAHTQRRKTEQFC